jgi:hypothetical protein
MSNVVLAATEKRLEELSQLPQRPKNIYELTEDGQAAGEDMDINQATLEAINAAHTAIAPDSYKGNEDLFDLAGEPDYVIEEFKFVRDVLMELPDTVLAALCKQRHWRVTKPA